VRFGSVCSGIEAASVAWNPIGFEAAWLAEIEPFPCALLAHHYPDVPNLGDMTTIAARVASGEVEAPDLFCGGTPCQAFSVAGLRNSLDDARGNLSLIFCEIANAVDAARSVLGLPPAIVFWENVPGVLNTKDNAFGCFLAGLAGENDPIHCPDGKWSTAGVVVGQTRTVAWRVLDAQYFGVAQRRRRVFVVASARAGFDPAEVLFEFDGVRRDSAPSREARESVAGTIAKCSFSGGAGGRPEGAAGNHFVPAIAQCLTTRTGQRYDPETETILPAIGWSEELNALVDLQPTIQRGGAGGRHEGVCVPPTMAVRRLTPTECERLQGFPDGYTLVPHRNKPAADGPRYKALGNSWAVPVVRWIGERIKAAL
jgi:DNA (cytosine-5)-methyltransferase 1